MNRPSSSSWAFVHGAAATTTTTVAYTTVTPDGSVDIPPAPSVDQNNDQDDGSTTEETFDVADLIATLPTNKFYINGSWVDPLSSTNVFDVIDPSTAAVVTSISQASSDDVDRAVMAAKEAWIRWSYHTTPKERQQLVQNLLTLYLSRSEDLAQLVTTEMGSPIDSARSNHVGSGEYNIRSALDMMMNHFEYERSLPNIPSTEDRATTIIMESVGVVGMITPWNWPLYQITLKVIPALLVGCTCVLKPSEQSPLSALLLADLFHQAGFPPGVFNLVNGDGPTTGDALSRHTQLDMISFTGSTNAGRLVATNAAMNLKRTSLELGGKGANILFADIGDEWMRESITNGVDSVFSNSGQTCNAPTRMFVERPYYDIAIQLAKDVADQTSVHSGHMEGDDHIGPVVSLRQYERVQAYIKMGIDEGATLIAGGLGRPDGLGGGSNSNSETVDGYYVRPTVFANCHTNMTIMQEEIFGPVLCITPFDTEEEVLEMANDTPYGLTNYVQTRNLHRRKRMGRLLQSGMVNMNDADSDDGSPFGGVKGSGNGREGGVYGLEEFCIIKAVTGYDEMDDDLDLDEDDKATTVVTPPKGESMS